MRIISISLVTIVLTSCATARAPYQMAITDWSGNTRPYYMAGEALNLQVYWDANQDAGKPVDCSVSNSFSGEIAWRGVLMIPESRPGQFVTATVWNPPYPETGIKLEVGSYIAVYNFNNEAQASVALNIVQSRAKNS